MRNLKKVLAMVLALVMSLSLVTIANATIDFDDVDAIEHKEAVDVMTAIGVIEGFEDGTYDPDGTLTREQAAKMIAYMLLGDKAEALGAMDTGFKDVASTRWSAPYIAYCVSLGIIDGAGDGNFYPAGKLTGYAFAKMLLCALGYGVKDEYVGTNWMLNVARDGVQINLYRNCDVSADPISRDDAAQLGFNALRSDLVSWSELFGTYSAYTMNYGKQELLGTLATNVFKLSTTYKLDDFGFNTRAWKQNNKVVTDYYVSDEIIDTITDATVAKGTLYKDYTWEKTASVYVNGDAKADLSTGSWKSSPAKAIANGETMYLVDSDEDGEIDKLVSTIEYLAKVSKVSAATSSADRTIDLKVWDGTNETTPISATKIETEEFEKDQYILIIPNDSAVKPFESPLAMKAAETVTGKSNAYYKVTTTGANPNGYVTIEGTKYAYNCIFGTNEALGSDIAEDKYSLNDATYAIYLDSNGYIIGVEEIEAAITDYAYILAKGEDPFQNHNIAKVLLSDGTIATYTVSSKSSKYATDTVKEATTPVDDSDATRGRIFGYSINDKGEIVLTDFTGTKYSQVTTTQANGTNGFVGGSVDYYDNAAGAKQTTQIYQSANVEFTKGYAAIKYGNNKYAYATDSTIFLYVNGSSVWTYVGKSNAPTIKAADAQKASVVVKEVTSNNVTTNYAEIVVIEGVPADSFTNNYVYVLNGSYMGYSYDKNGDKVFYYDVLKNGERTVIAAEQENTLRTGHVYKYNVDEAKFDGDANYDVEAGVYDLDVNGEGGNFYNGTDFIAPAAKIDVSSNGNVIVDANSNVNVALRDNYIIDAETNTTIVYTVDGTLNTSIKEVSTGDSWAVGDTALIVYKKVNSLKVAQDLVIVKKYDDKSVTTPVSDYTFDSVTVGVDNGTGVVTVTATDATMAGWTLRNPVATFTVTYNGQTYTYTKAVSAAEFVNGTFTMVIPNLQVSAAGTYGLTVSVTWTDNNDGVTKTTVSGSTSFNRI